MKLATLAPQILPAIFVAIQPRVEFLQVSRIVFHALRMDGFMLVSQVDSQFTANGLLTRHVDGRGEALA